MFIHNFKYSFKTLFKDKMLIFWTFAFPIILGTFFYMAFSNIEDSEKLDIIDIAIVDNEMFRDNEFMQEAFKILSDDKSEEKLFNVKYVNLDEANELLSDGEITGYLLLEDKPQVVIGTNGINETIFKFTLEEVSNQEKIVNNYINKEIQDVMSSGMQEELDINMVVSNIKVKVLDMINESDANIEDISSSNLSYTMIEYYTLIAMTCLYGGILGMVSINKVQANMSSKGARVTVSPTKKSILVISSLLASYLTQLIGMFILFMFTIFVINVDYGSNLPLIVFLSLVGCLAGLSLGIVISVLLKASESVKTGILIAVTMLGCFLSGMMGITMKYMVDSNIPILNKINPASMITDALYSLYYYEGMERYWFNIGSLLLFSIILITISISSLRRQRYDSI